MFFKNQIKGEADRVEGKECIMKSVLQIYSVLGLTGLYVHSIQAKQTLQSNQQAMCTALHESLVQPSSEKGGRQQSSKHQRTEQQVKEK